MYPPDTPDHRSSDSSPVQAAFDHAVLHHLQRTSRRLRTRLLLLTVGVPAVALLLGRLLGGGLADSVVGPFTLGMLMLTVCALAMVSAALWYDRASRAACDPSAGELRAQAPEFASAARESESESAYESGSAA